MNRITILAVFLLLIAGCSDSIVEYQSPSNAHSAALAKVPPSLPPTEVLYQFEHVTGGNTCSAIYDPGLGDYRLELDFLRDILTGGGPSGSTSVRVIVKDKFNNTLVDTWYNQYYSGHWYTYDIYLSPTTIGQCTITVIIPGGYDDALVGTITLHRNTTI